MQKITTFLMFDGKAEEAINFYISLFDDASVVNIMRYGPGQPGKEGSVMHAVFSLNGQQFMAIDSYIKHQFNFTPSMSLFVNCNTDAEIERLYAALSEGGQVLMPIGAYPFAQKYGWVSDRYGVRGS